MLNALETSKAGKLGPQLVLCCFTSQVCRVLVAESLYDGVAPSNSFILADSLGRSFKGINVHSLDDKKTTESLGDGDILVCDLGGLYSTIQLQLADEFSTVLVDGRCPDGSRASTCLSQSVLVPPETLTELEWWNALFGLASKSASRRRLVTEDTSKEDLPQYMNGLSSRAISLAMCFPGTFPSGDSREDVSGNGYAGCVGCFFRRVACGAGQPFGCLWRWRYRRQCPRRC